MSEHVVIIKTRKAVEEAQHPKGMSTHDGLVRIPASHANWLLKRIAELEDRLADVMAKYNDVCTIERVDLMRQELAEARAENEKLKRECEYFASESLKVVADLKYLNGCVVRGRGNDIDPDFMRNNVFQYIIELERQLTEANAKPFVPKQR